MPHTPGPWERLITDLGHEFNREGMIIECNLDDRHHYICRLFHPDSPVSGTTSHAPPSDEAIDNARLIASAPDLLEACQWVVDNITNEANPARIRCSEAIAKATGQQ